MFSHLLWTELLNQPLAEEMAWMWQNVTKSMCRLSVYLHLTVVFLKPGFRRKNLGTFPTIQFVKGAHISLKYLKWLHHTPKHPEILRKVFEVRDSQAHLAFTRASSPTGSLQLSRPPSIVGRAWSFLRSATFQGASALALADSASCCIVTFSTRYTRFPDPKWRHSSAHPPLQLMEYTLSRPFRLA